MTSRLVKHLTTGTLYEVLFIAKDATNETEGCDMVVYRSSKDGKIYVREKNEFALKFEQYGKTYDL